jgi:ribosomal protein L20A (L18A)
MATWSVHGSYAARRGYWQVFTQQLEAERAEAAREHALSQIGGCHRVGRHLIRIQSVEPVRS